MTGPLSEEQTVLMSARAQARHEAVRRLIAAHPEEYNELHAEERKARGLPETRVDTIDRLRAENARLLEQLRVAKQT